MINKDLLSGFHLEGEGEPQQPQQEDDIFAAELPELTDEFKAWRERRTAEANSSFLADLGMAIPRGVGHALNDVYDLADMLTFDVLPDWNVEDMVGEAGTQAGKTVTLLAQFILPYLAITKIGKIGSVAKASSTLEWFAKPAPTALRQIGKDAVAGAVTEFFFFDQMENLSTMSQGTVFDGLFPDALALEEDDSMFERRLKNTLEGAGLGVALDGMIRVAARALRKGTKIGESERQAVRDMLEASGVEVTDKAVAEEMLKRGSSLADELEQAAREIDTLNEQAIAERRAAGKLTAEDIGKVEPEQIRVMAADHGIDYDGGLKFVVDESDDGEAIREMLRTFKLKQGAAEEFIDQVRQNPRKMSSAERAMWLVENIDLNLAHYEGAGSAFAVIRVVEDMFRQTADAVRGEGVRTFDELAEAAMKTVQNDILKLTGTEKASHIARLTQGVKETNLALREINSRALGYRAIALNLSGSLSGELGKIADPTDLSLRELDRISTLIERVHDYIREFKGIPSEQGRGLAMNRITVRPLDGRAGFRVNDPLQESFNFPGGAVGDEAADAGASGTKGRREGSGGGERRQSGPRDPGEPRERTPRESGERKPGEPRERKPGERKPSKPRKPRELAPDAELDPTDLETLKTRIEQRGGREAIEKNIRLIKIALDKNGVAALLDISTVAKGNRSWLTDSILEFWVNSILSGPQTQTVNALSSVLTSIYRPLETVLGGIGQGFHGQFTKKNPQAWRSFQLGMRDLQGVLSGYFDMIRFAKSFEGPRSAVFRAFKTGETQLAGGTGREALGRFERGPALTTQNPIIDGMLNLFRLREGTSAGNIARGGVNLTGGLIRTPTRTLQAVDEAIKQVSARAHARAVLFDSAEQLGIPSDKAAGWVQQQMERGFREGVAINRNTTYNEALQTVSTQFPDLALQNPKQFDELLNAEFRRLMDPDRVALEGALKRSVDRAEEVTFTGKPRGVVIGGAAELITRGQRMPVIGAGLKFFFPFVRTPSNIATFTVERTPLDAALGVFEIIKRNTMKLNSPAIEEMNSRFAREIMSSDPTVRADAIGRSLMALGFSVTAWKLSDNFFSKGEGIFIVGGGPRDHREMEGMKAAGIQPYSLGWRDENGEAKSFAFSRVDPFGSILGIVADLNQMSYFADPADSESEDSIAATLSGAMASLTNNFTNKTYLRGLNDLSEVLTSGDDRKLESWVRRSAASFVPSLLNTSGDVVDMEMKHIRGISDAMANRTPWGREKLEPRRNALGEAKKKLPSWGADSTRRWAQLWSPITYSETSKDPIYREMFRLGHAWNGPPEKTTINGVVVNLVDFKDDKGRTAYDWMGEITYSGLGVNLKDHLNAFVQQPDYLALPEFSDNPALPNEKVNAISAEISRFRGSAKQVIIEKFPEIREFVESQLRERAAGPRSTGRSFPGLTLP